MLTYPNLSHADFSASAISNNMGATGPNFGVLVNIDKSLVICIDGLNHLKWGLFDNFCEKMFSSTSKIPAYGRPVI